MDERLLSLAAGTVLDVGPARAVDVAAAAGWRAVGIWHDPATWTVEVTTAVAARLRSTGLVALDVEPVILGRGEHHGVAKVRVAGELGARFLLLAGGPAGSDEVIEVLGTLADLAAAEAPELTIVLEFLPIFAVDSLSAAATVVAQVDRSNVGVLVDSLHLARSGGSPGDLAGFSPGLFPYLQLADAPTVPMDGSVVGLRDEALFGRLLPGDGALPLGELLSAVPAVPVSVELRSRELDQRYPDPVDRARAVLAATRRVLATE